MNHILISTFNCHKDTAHIQFQTTRNFHNISGTVLPRHLIQSFLPDEVIPELAHKIGKKLCDELCKENNLIVIDEFYEKYKKKEPKDFFIINTWKIKKVLLGSQNYNSI